MKTKKEIKEDYKQMKFPMGVFQIKNLSNNKIFVDNSVDMNATWNRHKTELKFGTHRNKELQKDWAEKGENNFMFEILSELKQDDNNIVNYAKELQLLQRMVIEEMDIPEGNMY